MLNDIRLFMRKIVFIIYYFLLRIIIPWKYDYSFYHGELSYLTKEEFFVWKQAMIKLLKEYCFAGYNARIRQLIFAFSNSKIEVVRKTNVWSEDIPIVVLCVKNDLARIQMLVDHYRSLGIKKFAFLDNGSDDGTFEWLLNQPEIDLFRCYEPYKTLVKEGWINRVISYYGFNRWYILTDSDELVVYRDMEKHSIPDVVQYAKRQGLKRIKGLTLDIYPNNAIFQNNINIKKIYRWIDTDSYEEIDSMRGNQKVKIFIGGPRYRLMNVIITLSKFPLVYFEPGTISDSAHYQFPHELINCSPCNFGILHYKFIDKDLKEYIKRSQRNSGFSSNGKYYKRYLNYIKDHGDESFMYEGSREFTNSEILDEIMLIQSINFDSECAPKWTDVI